MTFQWGGWVYRDATLERPNTSAKSPEKFLTLSLTVLCFDCEMCFNLASLSLYLTSIFLYFCNLAAWHCTVADALGLRHEKCALFDPIPRLCTTTTRQAQQMQICSCFYSNIISWEKMSCNGSHCCTALYVHVYQCCWQKSLITTLTSSYTSFAMSGKAIVILKYWLNS